VWWYSILLGQEEPLARFVAFAPQAAAVLLSGVVYAREPAVAVFLQTLAFVAFNKVVTAQYFLWYIALLPVAAAALPAHATPRLLGALALWLLSVLHWLFWAGLLEERSVATFPALWVASLLHFLASVGLWIVVARAANEQPSRLFHPRDPALSAPRALPDAERGLVGACLGLCPRNPCSRPHAD
jgi:GPI mannosyltransferase 1 subunit M